VNNTTEQITQLLPATLDKLVEATGKSQTTVRKALKELGATKTDDGTWTVRQRADHGRVIGDAATARDEALRALLAQHGELAIKQLAEHLNITVRATQHAVWRNRVERGGEVEHVGKGLYTLRTKKSRKAS
jgi:acyl-CoA reductase-like NAD-dependent aldehyde dehydrogenase